MIKLKNILQYDRFYIILLIITFIYILIYSINYKTTHIYNIDDTLFNIKILSYLIDEDKIQIKTSNLICNYYFDNNEEVNSFINNYSLGDTIKVYGTLRKPSNNTIPNTLNYKKYLNHKNIEYILTINSFKLLKKNKNIFYSFKNYIYKRIRNINNNEYIFAFVLGESSYIDESIYNNYKSNGIVHLFALSGLHVSFLASLIFKVLKKIKLKYTISLLIVSLILILFGFISNYSPSIIKAILLFVLGKLNHLFKLHIKGKNIFYLVLIIMLISNPNYIFYNGFILSITITYFIIIYVDKYKDISLFKLSILSFFSSLPIVVNMSYEVNILSFLNNLILIPLITSILFPISFICLIIPKFSFILKLAANIIEFTSLLCSKILTINIIIPRISLIEIIIYYIFLFIIVRYKKCKVLFVMFLIILNVTPLFYSDFVMFLDVSQGDSILIKKDKTILIDTGGQINNYIIKNEILYFKSIGIKSIDYLITTHGDFDHMGYSLYLIENFIVKNVVFNCGEYNDLETNLIKLLNKKKINYYSCIDKLDDLYFLQTKIYDNENDNSNVIYTEINGYKFMFMGDASIETEKEILKKYNISNIDVLKVGHHGSNTSSSESFINEMNPKYSVISVGKNNRYGHPNKEVLNNLNDSKIYRTDEDGSIMIKAKNDKLKIETCKP